MKRLLTLTALVLLASVAWSQQVGALIPEVFTKQVCDPNAANLPPDGSAWKQTLFVSLPASSGNAPPFYPQSPAGLQDSLAAWQVDSLDAWYLIVVTSEDAGGTGIHGPVSSSNTNGSLINGVSKPGATGCVVIESSDFYNSGLPTIGQTLCSHGIPSVNGGQREPGCTNDKGHLWLLQLDSTTAAGQSAFYACGGNYNTWGTSTCTSGGAPNPNNNILIRDAEITVAPGASTIAHYGPPQLVQFAGGPLNMGIEYSYIHGNDPGDPGQPTGACSSWTNTGSVTVAPDGHGNSTVTAALGTYFGLMVSSGAVSSTGGTPTATIGGTSYNIIADDGSGVMNALVAGTQNNQITVSGSTTIGLTSTITATSYAVGIGTGTLTVTASNTFTVGQSVVLNATAESFLNRQTVTVASLVGAGPTYTGFTATFTYANAKNYTNSSDSGTAQAGWVSLTESNVYPAKYLNGCGEDADEGLEMDGTQSWALFNYIEKIHTHGTETHGMTFGFSNGPNKIAHNWIEGGSCSLFSGGAAVDTRGGPANDMEIRGNVLAHDLYWRNLSAGAGGSPGPPFGCGPASLSTPTNSSMATCPFSWAMKNNFELKLGNRVLFDGNYLFGDWADSQSGFIILSNPRATSGGTVAGIYTILTANITSASGSGTVATYQTPAGNSFYVGMAVEQITGLSPVGFNCTLCVVTAATSTQFQVASTATGSATGTPVTVYGTGTPATIITNVTISNNWISDSPQGMELGTRSLVPGNGGGLSSPEDYLSILNNAWTNISDFNQWGTPGNDLIEWGGFGAQQFAAVMSRSGCPACVATATAKPILLSSCTDGTGGCNPVPVCGKGCGIADNAISPTQITAAGTCDGSHPPCIITVTASGTSSKSSRYDPAMGQVASIYSVASSALYATGTINLVANNDGTNTTYCTEENYTQIPSGGPCIRPDGTFGDTFSFSDPSVSTGSGTTTLCSGGGTGVGQCGNTSTGFNILVPTLAYKMLDMSGGDGVYTPGTGNLSKDSLYCYNTSTHAEDTTYEVGDNSPLVPALSPQLPTSLTVSFAQSSTLSNDSSGNTTCALLNNVGHPYGSIFSGNTVLTPSGAAINLDATAKQVVGNVFTNNSFAGPAGVTLGWVCGQPPNGVTGEGNPAFTGCADLAQTSSGLTEWGNAIVNQSGSSPAVLCAGTSCYTGGWVLGTPLSGGALPAQNWSPNAYSASAPTGGPGTGTAMGWPGFTGGTDTFPTGPCTYTSNDPTDCPLMGPPWSNNFTLASIGPVSSGGYPTYSVNVATMETAMTQLIYVLPASCATQSPACGTPYPDAPTFIPPPSNLGATIAGNATMGGKASAQ